MDGAARGCGVSKDMVRFKGRRYFSENALSPYMVILRRSHGSRRVELIDNVQTEAAYQAELAAKREIAMQKKVQQLKACIVRAKEHGVPLTTWSLPWTRKVSSAVFTAAGFKYYRTHHEWFRDGKGVE